MLAMLSLKVLLLLHYFMESLCVLYSRLLMSSEELRLFDKVRVFLDEDYSSAENFTVSMKYNYFMYTNCHVHVKFSLRNFRMKCYTFRNYEVCILYANAFLLRESSCKFTYLLTSLYK